METDTLPSNGTGGLSRKPSMRRQSSAPKKMVIKPFKVAPKPPEEFEEKTFQQLHDAVVAVHTKQQAMYSKEELYKSVENLCIHKKAEELYQKLYAQCAAHITATVQAFAAHRPADEVAFLTAVESGWTDHCDQMLTIRLIFLYLDRSYVLQTAKRSLWDMGLELLSEQLQRSKDVLARIVKSVLVLIDQERRGEVIKRSLLKNVLRMLTSLKLYADHFERPFIDATSRFYEEEGSQSVQVSNVPDYLLHVHKRLLEESERVVNYLDDSTLSALNATAEQQLITRHVPLLLQKGFDLLMDANKLDDLTRLYFLLARVDAVPQLRAAFLTYLKSAGQAIVTPPEKDKTMIEELLALKTKVDAIVKQAFNQNAEFVSATKEGFESFINSRENMPAELLARYIDNVLRTGKQSSEELEVLLDQLMVLFRYIHGKDVFQAFYRKHLARRLLLAKSSNKDAEKTMLQKLKTECGAQYTGKLENMFKDMELSTTIMDQFQKWAKSQLAEEKRQVELSVQVLTTGCWPEYVPQPLTLPPEVAVLQEEFQRYYLGKHNGRKLTWDHSLSTCELRGYFPKGEKFLAVSGLQATLLMLFNSQDSLTVQQICGLTKMDEDTALRTLKSLCLGEIKILMKEPKSAKLSKDDVFMVNDAFKHQLKKIKVNAVQMMETKVEQQKTNEQVFADRQCAIDACIVRIMKTRKSLSHALLMSEVIAQLKFPAKPADIKKRISSLIDREYMERDEKDSNVYLYSA